MRDIPKTAAKETRNWFGKSHDCPGVRLVLTVIHHHHHHHPKNPKNPKFSSIGKMSAQNFVTPEIYLLFVSEGETMSLKIRKRVSETLPCEQRPFDLSRKIEGPLLAG